MVHRAGAVAGPNWRPTPKRPYRARDAAVTSGMMAAVRGRENRAEIALRKALWRMGYRYRLHSKKLVGRPDIVLPKHRAVVFVDGDFWHGRALVEGGEEALRQVIRGERFEWWRDKLVRNIARDQQVTRELRSQGWRVIRIWESEVLAGVDRSARKVNRELRRR